MRTLQNIWDSVRKRALLFGEKINALSDIVCVLWLSLFYFVWRILTLPMFEFGGDAVWKWSLLRYFNATGTWMAVTPDHHQGRWCQNLPVDLVMRFFDDPAPWVASLVPILTGFALLLILWLITRSIGGSRLSAVLVWLTTMICPVFTTESAQFLPSLPAAMYTLLALWLIILYLKDPNRRFLPLCAGIVMGLAWGCKVTSIYWCAAISLFLLLHPTGGKMFFQWKRVRFGSDLLFFGIGFLLILIPETWLINRFFHVPYGRLSMLMTHVDAMEPRLPYNLFEYLISPVMIFLDVIHGKFILVLPPALLFLLMICPLALQWRKKDLPLQQRLLAFSLVIALIFHCYMVISVFPFKHPERPLPRYFATLYYVSFIILYTAKPLLPTGKNRWKKALKLLWGGVFAAMLAVMFIAWLNDPLINNDNLFSTIRATRCIEKQKKENLPILIRCHKGKYFNKRTFRLALAAKAFTEPPAKLPDFSIARQELMKQWQARPLLQDAKGICYFQAGGRVPQTGKEEWCVVIRDENWSLRPLKIVSGGEKESKETR